MSVEFLIQKRIEESPFRELVSYLTSSPNCQNIAIIGGFARDALFADLGCTDFISRDIDIVLEADVEPDLQQYCAKITHTPLGGIRLLNSKGVAFADIWLLRNTVFFLEKQIEPSFDNLVRGMLFNIERIGYVLPSRQVIDHGATRSILNNRLSYVAEFGDEVCRLHIHAIRAVILCERYGLFPDESVKQMIARSCYFERIAEIYDYFTAKNYSSDEVNKFIKKVQEQRGG